MKAYVVRSITSISFALYIIANFLPSISPRAHTIYRYPRTFSLSILISPSYSPFDAQIPVRIIASTKKNPRSWTSRGCGAQRVWDGSECIVLVILHVLQSRRKEHHCRRSQCITVELYGVSEALPRRNFADVLCPHHLVLFMIFNLRIAESIVFYRRLFPSSSLFQMSFSKGGMNVHGHVHCNPSGRSHNVLCQGSCTSLFCAT
ncbi:hypothetical protein F5146DRAFT_765547 [Armillaria mellea]|nr:hypothetical protein F5146DRAFT_765547 [Armillaria mellea]